MTSSNSGFDQDGRKCPHQSSAYLSEVDLVRRAQDGDPAAFGALVEIHQARLFRVAFMTVRDRHEAEDVVQETLLTAWRHLESLGDPAAFGGWVTRICSRRATDVVRRHASRATSAFSPQDAHEALETLLGAGRETSPESGAVVQAQMAALASLLGDMSPEIRVCWALREIEGMPYQDIAQSLAIPETTVRGRIARARARIVEQMRDWR